MCKYIKQDLNIIYNCHIQTLSKDKYMCHEYTSPTSEYKPLGE